MVGLFVSALIIAQKTVQLREVIGRTPLILPIRRTYIQTIR